MEVPRLFDGLLPQVADVCTHAVVPRELDDVIGLAVPTAFVSVTLVHVPWVSHF